MPYGDIFSFANNQKAQQAAEPDDNYGMPSNWAPINSAPIDPNKPAATRTPASIDPYGSGPLPPNFGYQPALVRSGYGGTAAPIDLMPIQGAGVTQANAKAIGVATTIVTKAIAGISSGATYTGGNGIQISSANVIALEDPTIHGDSIVDVDSAVVRLYDDFTQFNVFTGSFTSNFISALPWMYSGNTTGGNSSQSMGAPPYLGQVLISNGSSKYTGSASAASIMNLYSAGASSSGWPLIENPSWKMVWNFAIGRPYEIFNSGGSGGTPPAFSWTQVQFYIGLGLLPQVAALASTNSPRPNAFVGLRYDTDPGTSYTVTACTTSSGGTSTYTGTFGGGTNAFVNQTFVITGFSNLVNNGTFVCTGSTASTLVLKNASASVQSGATAFAASNALSDTQFVFEAVNNYNFSVQRNSAPGNTSPTGISVVEGRNYRFEMTCTVAGQVTMLLTDGTTSYSATLTVPTISFPAPPGTAANQTLPGYIHNGVGIISNDTPIPPFVGGSIINSSGWSSALASFNQTALQLISPGTDGCICFLNANSGTGPTSQSATLTGYSALLPWVGFGNDSQSSPTASSKAIMIDAFEFEWNPGINSSNALTPNSLKPRYW